MLNKGEKSECDSCSVDYLRPHGLYIAHLVPLSMESSRQEYWSGLPFPSPGDIPNPEIEPGSPTLQADSLPSESPWGRKHYAKAQSGKYYTMWGQYNKAQETALLVLVNVKIKSCRDRPPEAREGK